MDNDKHKEYADPEEVDLFDYIKVIVNWRWLILGITIITVLSTAVFTTVFNQEQLFQAEALILTEEPSDYLLTGIDERVFGEDAYKVIMFSKPFLRDVINQEYTYSKNGESLKGTLLDYFETQNITAATHRLKNSIKIENVKGGFLSIKVEATDSVLSASVANEVINQLNIYNRERRNSNARSNVQFIENRLNEVKEELQNARDSLVVFLNGNKQLLRGKPGETNPYPILTAEKDKLEQEITLKANLYNTLSSQYELAKIEAQKEASVITVIEFAEPPLSPLPGNAKKNVLIAFLAGLFISVTLAFILNYFEGMDKETKGFFSKQFQKEKKLLSLFWRNGRYGKIKDEEKA